MTWNQWKPFFFGRIFCSSYRLFQSMKSVFLATFSSTTIDSFNQWNLFFQQNFLLLIQTLFFGNIFCYNYRLFQLMKSIFRQNFLLLIQMLKINVICFFRQNFLHLIQTLEINAIWVFCGQIFCYLQLCELTSTFNPKTRIVWGPTLVQSSWYSRIFFPTHELVILTKFHKDLQDIVHFWIVEKFGVSPFFSISF